MLRDLFDEPPDEDSQPTSPALDPEAYARDAAMADAYVEGDRHPSGIRPSFPTLTNEVGALPNEPEEDTLLRRFGCGARVLEVCASSELVTSLGLEPRHAYVLSLLDGKTAICDVLDMSALPRKDTLHVLDYLLGLSIVW